MDKHAEIYTRDKIPIPGEAVCEDENQQTDAAAIDNNAKDAAANNNGEKDADSNEKSDLEEIKN